MHIDNNCFSKSARSATVISDIKDIIFYYLAYSKVRGFNKKMLLHFPFQTSPSCQYKASISMHCLC